jgi:hypothetical protein
MRYEGISWNEQWVRSMEEEVFVHHPLNADRWTQPGFAISTEQRVQRLHELWKLLNPEKVKHADDQQSIASGGEGGLAFPAGEQLD